MKFLFMMDNLFRCWTFCLKRCPCCGGNRVGPAKSDGRVVVRTKKSSKLGCCSRRSKTRSDPVHLINGETNLYFQGDEITFGIEENTNTVPVPHLNSNGQCSEIREDSVSPHDQNPEAESQEESPSIHNYIHEEFLSILYVETGKGKELRVVHIVPNVDVPSEEIDKDDGSNSIGEKSGSVSQSQSSATTPESEGESEEEEYWFTRWSRRPRLKNSFKGSIVASPIKDDPAQTSCIETRVAKEIEKYQMRNKSKRKVEVGVRTRSVSTVPVSDSSSRPGDSRKNSNSSNCVNSSTNGPEESSVHKNGGAKSFTNFGFQPEERITEIKTETLDDTDIIECPPEAIESLPSPSAIGSINYDGRRKLQPLLFFIHGISGSSDVWKSQFDFFLAAGFEIVAPDLLGHGLSSTPKSAQHYLFESLVQDLVKVFDHFAKDERQGVVIGHGYGACLATVLSRVRPKNVCLLVSISGGGPTAMAPPAAYRKPLLPYNFSLFAKKGITARFDNPDLEHVLPKFIRRRILDGQLWVDGDTSFHRRVSVPTLLIYGLRDQVVSLIEECEMERTIPRAFLELIPSAGHMVMWDEPLKLSRMILKFIQSWV